MSPELTNPNEIEKYSNLLSGITGLKVTSLSNFPELNTVLDIPHFGEEKPFTYNLILGEEGDQYKIDFAVVFSDKHSPGKWLPTIRWNVSYNDYEVFNVGGMTNVSNQLLRKDFSNHDKIHSLITTEFDHAVGGPKREVAFMDFETYSLASLSNEHSYFENIYLALMIHMKERGLAMPPILSKRDYIREPMKSGDVEKVNKILSTTMTFGGTDFDKRIRGHMEVEAEAIRRHAQWEAKKRNHDIPLEEAFPYAKIIDIERGRSAFGKYTLLAVENDLRNFGDFSEMVLESMENDGRYSGSRIILEFNLSECMDLCKSGRIDVIIFDWSNPSYEEVWMVKPETINPFYEMYNGKSQAVLSADDDGIKAATPDGKLLDWEATKAESERVDIRNRWMDMIADACEQNGIEPPPFFIVRSTAEFRDIAKIVSQKLGKPIFKNSAEGGIRTRMSYALEGS